MLNYNFYLINRLYFELTDADERYRCTFLDGDEELYSAELGKGEWMAIGKQYLSNYFVEIRNLKGVLKHRISFLNHIKGKKVFLTLGSDALGDTIAWASYFLEFKKKYQCEVVASTFKNFLFDYPEIEWVRPGARVEGIHAMIDIGWHYNKDKDPLYPPTIPLQQTATETLHLPYKEIRPRLAYKPKPTIDEKYVCISTKSTAQCKHWYYWPELIERLKDMGYRVFELSKEADDYGAETLEDKSLENVMDYLANCEFYIGLSSGISWLAWAMNVKVVMISNFTTSDHEFECIRIENRNVCNGCWNDPMFLFDKGNWDWCPRHEDTPRHFECHKKISVQDVIDKLPIQQDYIS